MQKKTIWKDTFREIWRSKTRFLAILLIIFIGVAFFVGISATGPDMLATVRDYFAEKQLMDHRIVSNYGLEQEDIDLLNEQKGIQVQPHYTADIITQETQSVLRLFSYQPSEGQEINAYTLSEGRLPEQSGEIALDDTPHIKENWSIGDTLTVDWSSVDDGSERPLAQSTFEVVGFVRSPLFIEHTSRGSTNVGGGTLEGFGVVHADDFTLDIYTEAYVSYQKPAELVDYTEDYQHFIADKEEELENLLAPRKESRYNQIVTDIQNSVSDGEEEIEKAKKQLRDARHQLVQAEMELNRGREKLNAGYHEFHEKIGAAKEQIAEYQRQIDAGSADLSAYTSLLQNAGAQLDQGEALLNEKEAKLQLASDALLRIKQAQAELNQGKEQLAAQEAELQEGLARLPQLEQMLSLLNQLGYTETPAVNLAEIQGQVSGFDQKQADLEQESERLRAQASEIESARSEVSRITELLGQMDELGVDELDGQTREALESERAEKEQIIQAYDQAQSELENAQNALAEQSGQIQMLRGLADWMNSQQIDSLPALSQSDLQSQITQIKARQQELETQKQLLEDKQQELDQGKNQLPDMDTIQNGQQRLRESRQLLNQEKQALSQAWGQLADGEARLRQGQSALHSGREQLAQESQAGRQELSEGADALEEGRQQLEEGRETFAEESAEANEQITAGEEEIQAARQQLDELPELEYIFFNRSDNPGYSEYEDNAERMKAIAGVFPVFFFFIAILISLTTMTRMVDEEREYIGTMKALGYRNGEILIKFITYAFIATIVGATLGLIVGYRLFPKLIFNAYSSLYNLSPITIQSYPVYTLLALVASFVSTVGATLYAVHSSLKSNAAELLRPKAPKKGTHILMEKIPAIWERLSFNYKITLRNVFRYKTRMLMTIFGVAGSTALILTGFGISDSISDIPNIQYGDINQFQAYVALDTATDDSAQQSYEQKIADSDAVSGAVNVMQENVTITQEGVNEQTAVIMVPEDIQKFYDYVQLLDTKSLETVTLPEEGALITQKLAELFGLEVGDELIVESSDDQEWTIPISGIVRNYVGHFIYLSGDQYKHITGYTPKATQSLIKYDSDINEAALGEELMTEEAVVGVLYVSDIHQGFLDTITSLNLITHVLVISAALLTLIVLYNLTNINVAERIRELSTIKVLGFYDREVTQYVYRENWILTFLGILAGFVGGWFLHQFLIRTTEVDMLLFSRRIDWSSYLYAIILVVIFSLIVMVIIHRRLKKIDMVEALKGGE